ncbi:MAG: DUF2892 domain-containing protein [Balneolales bacterium]|nr:DUF2892 domain-containing protein [Balneolales bacterium]
MGLIDKILRITVALVIVLLFFAGFIADTVAIVLLALAGIFVITSFISFCPLYAPFGIKTCKTKA